MSDLRAAVEFLTDLEANNTKEWFQANKKRYERELKGPARDFVAEVNERLRAISPAHASDTPHKALNRINRDIRFSKDKTPYNTRAWAGFHDHTRPKGEGAGFFVGFSPSGVGIGCGIWAPPKDALASLRTHIAEHHADLKAALDALPEGYGPLDGDKLKRVPKPWDQDHPAGEWLKHKGFHVRIELPVETAYADDFADTVEANFRSLTPVVAFLGAGLG